MRIVAFLLGLLLLWLPIALPLAWLIHDANQRSIVTLVVLYLEFIGLVRLWGRRVYREPLLTQYGLEVSWRSGRELFIGWALGILSLSALLLIETAGGWISWQSPALPVWRLLLEAGLVSLGIGFAEELLFRGWLLNELQRDYRPSRVLWVDAAIYAALHGFRPQFPALLLLGMALVWAKRLTARLGLAIGLHAGLVGSYYLVNVGHLFDYSGRAPEWITGLDRNPLAGVLGVLCLSGLAIGMRQAAQALPESAWKRDRG